MKSKRVRGLFYNFTFVSIAVLIAANTSKGISYNGDFAVLIIVALILSILNLILKPALMLFALPFIIVTLGFGIWIINALLFMFVGLLVPHFEVLNFYSALWGAFLVSVMSMFSNIFTGNSLMGKSVNVRVNNPGRTPPHKPLSRKDDEDIIDI